MIPLVADSHGNVTGRFDNAAGAALGTGANALHHQTLVDIDRSHLQLINVSTLIVLGVGNGRLQHLLDDLGAFFSIRSVKMNPQEAAKITATSCLPRKAKPPP